MENKTVRTPEYWKDKTVFGELIEVETAYGHKAMIPKKFMHGWRTAKLMLEWSKEHGQDPLEFLDPDDTVNPLFYDLHRVFFEMYEG